MPWQNDNGNNEREGPWGSRQGSWTRGSRKPNLEDIIRRGQDRFRTLLPRQWTTQGGVFLILAILLGAWLSSGLYWVDEQEQAVILRFGKWVRTTHAGLSYHLPYPIEAAIIKKVSTVNQLNIGHPLGIHAKEQENDDSSRMLTGDENIVEVEFTVSWFIKDLAQYFFQASSPDDTVKIAAESVIREIIAQTPIATAMTTARGEINGRIQKQSQKLIDEYKLGIQILTVNLQRVDPPATVLAAVRDVQAARADQQRFVNEAEKYRNSVVPVAEGEASKIIQAAEGDNARRVAEAEGDAGRFTAINKEYRQNPQIVRINEYLKTMREVLSNANKLILDKGAKGAQGVIPYLPLPALKTPNAASSAPSQPATEIEP